MASTLSGSLPAGELTGAFGSSMPWPQLMVTYLASANFVQLQAHCGKTHGANLIFQYVAIETRSCVEEVAHKVREGVVIFGFFLPFLDNELPRSSGASFMLKKVNSSPNALTERCCLQSFHCCHGLLVASVKLP